MSAYGTAAYMKQILYQTNKIYIRYNNGTAVNANWSAWNLIGNIWTYSAFLSQSLLPNGKLEDMRTQNLVGLYGFSSSTFQPSDLPSDVLNGIVININLYADISIQMIFNQTGGIKSRTYWYGTWSSWG